MPEGTQQPVERDPDAPEQPAAGQGDQPVDEVDLLGIMEDEFGLSRSRIRQEAYTGICIIDGEKYDHEGNFTVPHEKVQGKTVEVKGYSRTFRFQVQ